MAAAKGNARAREPGECRIEKGSQDFAHAVGAEVEAEQSVPVPHAAVVADDGRHHELVGDIMGICVRDRRVRIGKAWPLRVDDRVVGFADAVPTIVAVHRVVAAANGSYRNPGWEHRGQASHIALGRLRRRIASVGEDVKYRQHAGLG